MLKLMRESFQHLKWILVAIVAIFILFIFVDWGAGFAGSRTEGGYAARVNGETISRDDYSRALKNYEQMYSQMYGQQFTPEMAQAMGLSRQVIEQLVDQRLLVQEAKRLNLDATPAEVREKLLAIPTLNPDGKFVGMELYTRFVTGPLGYPSPAAFEQDLARDIIAKKMQSAMESAIMVSPKAAEAEFRRTSENAKIRYVLYPATRELPNVTVSKEEVDTYYRNNQGRYAHGEQRQVRYLLADTTRLRGMINPSEAELRKRYETSREEFKRPESAHVLHILIKVDPGAAPAVDAAAKAKADTLVQQLRAGGDFAAAAKANSQDPSSSATGGDMGFIDRGRTVEAFENAIFSLPLNQVDVVRSPEFGYHIVKVLERRAAGYRAFEEVRGELAARVADDMAQEQARTEITRIAELLRQKKPKVVEEFIANANDKVASYDTGWFTKSEPIPNIGANQPLTTWAFSAKANDIGEVTGTQKGMLIPFLAGVRPAGISSLDEIRQRVEADAKTDKARVASREALARAVTGAPNIEAIAQKTGMPALETTINRQGFITGFQGDTTALVTAVMAANVGQLGGPVAVGDGAVAFQVLEQKKVTPAELVANRASYVDAVRQQQLRSLRAVLLQRLKKEAKIEINPDLLATPQQGQPPVGM